MRGVRGTWLLVSLGNTSSLPDGGHDKATAAQCPPGLGGSDKLCTIIGLVAQTLVVGEYPPQLRIVALALVDQHSDELRLDKLVAPLSTRADSLAQKRRDCRLEAGVVAVVGPAVIAAIGEFAFRDQSALGRLCQINRYVMFHALAL
jgi:hypothetical protein